MKWLLAGMIILLGLLLIASKVPITKRFFSRKNNTILQENFSEKISSASADIIAEIPLPKGFERVNVKEKSFAAWLRNLEIKKSKNLHYYNGKLSNHQNWVYGIINIDVPSNGLQQCADAIMRLKAEYLYTTKQFQAIKFGNQKHFYSFLNDQNSCTSRDCFNRYLNQVFAFCGTYTLEEMSKQKDEFEAIEPTDLLVKGGSPGHAMLVADVATNKNTGEKLYLLLQSYSPSEDVHIVVNQANSALGPWYKVEKNEQISTPGYTFAKQHLRSWN